MAETNIEWTATRLPDGTVIPGFSFNPWIGCAKVSAGCKMCYAENSTPTRTSRSKGVEAWGPAAERIVTSYANWKKVLTWQREAQRTGIRRKVFCLSLGDVFENWKGQMVNHRGELMWFAHEDRDSDGIPTFRAGKLEDLHLPELYVPLTMDIVRQELFRLIDMTPDLDWLLLTKRPENIGGMWPRDGVTIKRRDNVWLGASVENQQMAGDRVIRLIEVAPFIAKQVFVSVEPMLGPISLYYGLVNGLDWVIVGGESGPKKRPFNTDWARSLRDECAEAGVAFFMKQVDKVQPIPEDLLIRQFPGA